MADKARPIPDGFHTLTPHLTVRDAAKAIDFHKQAFGAEVRGVSYEGKKVIHAALKIGDSMLMLNDEFPEWGTLSPLSSGNAGTGVAIHIYVEDVDSVFNRAVSAGATVKMPLMDQFWGDRYGQVVDPFGHRWSLATHVRDLSEEEMQAAREQAFSKMPKSA